MKKIITILLAGSLAGALAVGLTACGEQTPVNSQASTVVSQAAGQTSNTYSDASALGSTGIANPWVECQTMEEAVNLAGFDFKVPELSNYVISVIPNEMIQVTYPRNESEEIVLRRSPGEGDISGDYTEYKETGTIPVKGIDVNVRKQDDKIYVAYFTAFDGTYSVSCTAGMTEQEVTQIMEEIYTLNAK